MFHKILQKKHTQKSSASTVQLYNLYHSNGLDQLLLNRNHKNNQLSSEFKRLCFLVYICGRLGKVIASFEDVCNMHDSEVQQVAYTIHW
jgi:hypothetical protein